MSLAIEPEVDVHVLAYSGKADWLGRCLGSLEHEPCRVQVIHGGFDGHIGAARAHAFTLASAPYVSWVDDDDWVIPGLIGACVGYLNAHYGCVGVYTDYYVVDELGEVVGECCKGAWDPLKQLVSPVEVLHLHVTRRAPVMNYLEELQNWPTFEEYVLLGLLAGHGYWHHLPIIGYCKRRRPSAVSSMRLATPALWKAAVRRVAPVLLEAKKRYAPRKK